MQSLALSALRYLGVVSPVPALLRPLAGATLVDDVRAAAGSFKLLNEPCSALGQSLADLPSSTDKYGAVLDLSELMDLKQLGDTVFKHLQPVLASKVESRRLKRLLLLAPHIREHVQFPVSLSAFTRSLAKELARSGTAVNALVANDGAGAVATALFALSPSNSYMTGQTLNATSFNPRPAVYDPFDALSLAGRTVAVTGAARGIGAAIATVLAINGVRVIGIDQPAMSAQLRASPHVHRAVAADITRVEETCAALQACLQQDGVVELDGIVHNAGITRDKLLRSMTRDAFEAVMSVNLFAPVQMNGMLYSMELLQHDTPIVYLSSINGIAGAAGQTNYSTSKGGLLEYTAWEHEWHQRVHAVAPGFIETEMTAAMPFFPRLMASQMCAFAQAGQPADVARMVAFLLTPAAKELSGTSVRVCGGHFVGA